MLLFVGQVLAVHVQELGAHQAEAHCPIGQRLLQFDRQLEIALEPDLDAVACHRRDPPQAAEMTPLTREILPFFAVGLDRLGAGVEDDRARGPVDDHLRRRIGAVEQARDPEHGGQSQAARHDCGMALGAAELGGKAANPPRIH